MYTLCKSTAGLHLHNGSDLLLNLLLQQVLNQLVLVYLLDVSIPQISELYLMILKHPLDGLQTGVGISCNIQCAPREQASRSYVLEVGLQDLSILGVDRKSCLHTPKQQSSYARQLLRNPAWNLPVPADAA